MEPSRKHPESRTCRCARPADSLQHGREMVAAGERARRLYMVSQSRRYNAQLAALRRLISERVGQLGLLDSDFYIGAPRGTVGAGAACICQL